MRTEKAIVAVLVAFLVAAIGGLNRWASVWLEAGYRWYELTVVLVVWFGLSLSPKRLQKRDIGVVLLATVSGYVGGILGLAAATFGLDDPAGRLARSISQNTLAAVGVYLFFPVVLGSWVFGLLAGASYVAMRNATGRRWLVLVTVTGLGIAAVWIIWWFVFRPSGAPNPLKV